MSEELKPCPFCGGHASITRKDVEPQGDPYYGAKVEDFVQCDDCGCVLFDQYFHEGFNYDKDAIKAWNTRTVQAAPSDREKRLETALQAADDLVDVMQFPDSVTELYEVLRNRACLLRHEMRCPDSIKAAENAMNAFSELSGAIFSCGIGARDKAIKNYVSVRAALADTTNNNDATKK